MDMRETFAEQARQNTMDLVTNMGDDMKNDLREILAKNLEEGKGMRDTARDMENKVDEIDRTRAQSIARTETTNAKNLGNHYKYSEKGYQSFTVDFTSDACPDCIAAYDGIVFSIDDVDMLPALHPNCMCNAIFHEETPEEYADKYGYDIYGGGSGGDASNEFSSNDEFYAYAEDNLLQQYDDILNKDGELTDKGMMVDRYKNTEWYKHANNYARGLPVDPNIDIPTLKKEMEVMDSVFENKFIDKDIIVYRSVENIFEGVSEKTVKDDKGYMSTTASLEYAKEYKQNMEDGYIMKIIVPENTVGIQVETALQRKTVREEGEWLMPRDSYLYLVSIDHNQKWVEAVVVNDKIY